MPGRGLFLSHLHPSNLPSGRIVDLEERQLARAQRVVPPERQRRAHGAEEGPDHRAAGEPAGDLLIAEEHAAHRGSEGHGDATGGGHREELQEAELVGVAAAQTGADLPDLAALEVRNCDELWSF